VFALHDFEYIYIYFVVEDSLEITINGYETIELLNNKLVIFGSLSFWLWPNKKILKKILCNIKMYPLYA